jgi:hypothetical protein
MAKIRFENGTVVNFEGVPTQKDIDEIASKVGAQQPAETPGGVVGALKNGWQGLKESLNKRVDNTGAAMNANQSVASKALQVAGQGFGTIGDVVGAGITTAASAITPDSIEQPIKEGFTAGVKKIMGTETAQSAMKTYDQFKKDHPELAGNLEAVANIADAALMATGVGEAEKGAEQVVKQGIKTGAKVAAGAGEKIAGLTEKVADITKKVGTKAGEFTGSTEVDAEVAKKAFKENLLQQIEGKSSSIKKLDKTRSDVIDTIASDPRYHPTIDAENKTFNVSNASKNLAQDRQSYVDQLANLFGKVDEKFGGYDTNSIIQKVSENVLGKNNTAKLVAIGGKDSSFVKETQQLLGNIKKVYGEKVPRNEIWKLRQTIDKAINSMSDNQVAKSLRQDVRKAFAQSLETSLPGDTKDIVKRTMGEMQKVIEAENYTNDVLKGFKIQGGKMTDLIRNAVGAEVGKSVGVGTLGGGILGGVPGAAAGFVASKKIGEWLAKNTLLNASQKNAILKVVKETPEVFDDMKKYIDSLSKESGTKSLKEGILKLGK